MLNHEFDLQKNEALNKACMKVAPKNMVFSKSHSLSDWLALVISYDSIGYLGCIISICRMLVGNPKYMLGPIEKPGQNNKTKNVCKTRKRKYKQRERTVFKGKTLS